MSGFSCFVIGNGVVPLKCLEILAKADRQVLGTYSTDGSLQRWSEEHGVSHATSRRAFCDRLLSTEYDYLFSINNGWIIPAEIIARAHKATLNYHDSPLPKYAGLHATSWALLHGETQHAISWHEVVPDIDAGRIFKQKIVPIQLDDTAFSLNTRCFEAAVVAFAELVRELEENRIVSVAQDLSQRSYFGPEARPEAACILSFDATTRELYNLVRSLDFGPTRNPLGLAKLWLPGGVVTVGVANPVNTASGVPGQILSWDAEGLCIATADTAIRLSRFATLTGEALSEDRLREHYGVNPSVVLPILEPADRNKITQDNASLCRHERAWVKHLSELAPFQHPYLQKEAHSSTLEQECHYPINLADSVKPQALLAVFAAYCARLSTEAKFDLALQTQTQQYLTPEFFARQIPLRVQIEEGEAFSQFQNRFEESLKGTSKLGSYALDVFVRHSELSNCVPPNRSSVAIVLATSPAQLNWSSLDSALALVTYEDGSQPELVHNGILDRAHSIAIVEQLQNLMTAALESPEQPLHSLPLLSDTQQHQILVKWNQTAKSYPRDCCIHELFAEQVLRTPNAPAVCFGDVELSYQELDRRSNQLAHWLHELGIKPDSAIALCVPRSVELIVGLLGILKAGGAYIPIDPTYPADRIAYLIEDSCAQAVVTIGQLRQVLFAGMENAICLDDRAAILAEFNPDPLKTEVGPENLAYILYTSGSTGKPKGVEISHRSLINHSWAIADNYGLGMGDRMLQSASISFDVAGEQIYPALFRGATVVIRPNDLMESFERFSKFVASQAITAMILPTAFWHEWTVELLESDQKVPASVRVLSVGTEKALGHRLEQWQKVSEGRVAFFQGYGPTEATVTCTMYCHDGRFLDAHAALPIGRPLPNTEIYILDRSLQPLPVGVAGDLYVGGDGLARGYYQRPDLTQERFIAHPFSTRKSDRLYKTGDLARFEADGQIVYCGRTDDQVKLNGFRIELGEIEAALNAYPAVKQAIVYPYETATGVRSLVAYVIPNPHQSVIIDALKTALKQTLPPYMVPSAVVAMDAFPLMPNGKIDRKALPKPTLDRPQSTNSVAPQNETEQKLIEIWESVLGVQSIGIRDNYFELGGTSLQAVRLFAQIEKIFNKVLPLSVLLQSPCIEQLATLLGQKGSSEPWSALVPIQTSGAKPPLFCIHGGGFNVLIYRDLAVNLGPDRPIYGLQAHGLDGDRPNFSCIEDLAADYVREIQRLQPQGPYFLAGLSNGGNIALEMAQQLNTQGQQVSLLAMFDSYAPDGIKLLSPFPRFLSSLCYALQYSGPRFIAKHLRSDPFSLVRGFGRLIRKHLHPQSICEVVPTEPEKEHETFRAASIATSPLEQGMNRLSQYILVHSPWSFFSPSAQLQGLNSSISKTLKQLEETYGRIHREYIPKIYAGKIVLFRAQEAPPGYHLDSKLGWGKIALGGVDVHRVPGHHVGIMESKVLAEKMRFCLEATSCRPNPQVNVRQPQELLECHMSQDLH